MAAIKNILASEDIAQRFGLNSKIFHEIINYIKEHSISLKENYKKKFKYWAATYKDIYGEKNSLNSDLFFKHTYYALILKAFLIIKLGLIQNLDVDDIYENFTSNNLDDFNLFEIDKYFYWVDIKKDLFEKIFSSLEFSDFALQDLFQKLYQQIFLPITRHKIGEFYTPSNLVRKMVDDCYNVQNSPKVLVPSCGSGNFLVYIIEKILKSKRSDSSKINAINNIYGLDVNPLATLTAKVNILLLLLDNFDIGNIKLLNINIYLKDSLFNKYHENDVNINLKSLYSSFDLIIGNPPWLTYKDLDDKDYQDIVRNLAEELEIKPSSQYITHIELATLFFYDCTKFLKIGGAIFFVITKSVLNGDHCYRFRAFSLFNNLEIWDFPDNYFFNVNHICLKAEYTGKNNNMLVEKKYPIKAKVFDHNLGIQEETYYSSMKIEKNGAKIILPIQQLKLLNEISYSQYKKRFFQGATLVPRTLVFFHIEKKLDSHLVISTDPEIISRAKKEWRFSFKNKEIEENFKFKTFLNKDLVPFCLKRFRYVFLPITNDFQFDIGYLKEFPKAFKFYNEVDKIYQKNKKQASKIVTLFSNLNYWNKLTKQFNNKTYLTVYNASGSSLKAAVIKNFKKNIIVASENYYFSTDILTEAYYLSAVLNSPILSDNIKLIKSSRHIHKRPFSFPIPMYDENCELHNKIAKLAKEFEANTQQLLLKNPKVTSEKLRLILNQDLQILNDLVKQIVFQIKK